MWVLIELSRWSFEEPKLLNSIMPGKLLGRAASGLGRNGRTSAADALHLRQLCYANARRQRAMHI